jgi:hypothetical protein
MGYGNNRAPYPHLGIVGIRGVTDFFTSMLIGASGAITSQVGISARVGLSVVKTATKTGRYTISLPSAYKHFLGGNVTLVGPTDAIWGANTVGGPYWFWRNNNIDGGTAAGTVDLQFAASTDNADADLPSGTVAIINIVCGKGV